MEVKNELSMEETLAKQLCSYHIGLDNISESDKPFKYLLTGRGALKVMQNKIGLFVTKTEDVPGLPKVAEGLRLTIPKLPYHMLLQTIAFFKAVMATKNNAEAMLQFYFNEATKEYIIHCPEQEVSGASVHFERDEDMDTRYLLVMDIHSH